MRDLPAGACRAPREVLRGEVVGLAVEHPADAVLGHVELGVVEAFGQLGQPLEGVGAQLGDERGVEHDGRIGAPQGLQRALLDRGQSDARRAGRLIGHPGDCTDGPPDRSGTRRGPVASPTLVPNDSSVVSYKSWRRVAARLAVTPPVHTARMESSTTAQFAHAARTLALEARRRGLVGPSFRCPPRIVGVDRTLRRRPDGAVVAVRLRGRPWPAVLADMIEGVVAVNGLPPPQATRLRTDLWGVLGPQTGDGGSRDAQDQVA